MEEQLVAATIRVGSPFASIVSISNPGLQPVESFPACQFWFETYRTTKRDAVAGVLRLEQDVVFGSNILVSASDEAEARRQAYGLSEEVQSRLIGFMPQIRPDIEVTFPIHDIEASFTQIEETGLFTLTIMWSLTWQISNGAKP